VRYTYWVCYEYSWYMEPYGHYPTAEAAREGMLKARMRRPSAKIKVIRT